MVNNNLHLNNNIYIDKQYVPQIRASIVFSCSDAGFFNIRKSLNVTIAHVSQGIYKITFVDQFPLDDWYHIECNGSHVLDSDTYANILTYQMYDKSMLESFKIKQFKSSSYTNNLNGICYVNVSW